MLRTIDDRVLDVLRRVGICLQVAVDYSEIDLADVANLDREGDELALLRAGARRAGLFVKEAELDASEVRSLLVEGLPVIAATPDGRFWVFEKRVGKNVEASQVGDSVTFHLVSPRELRELIGDGVRLFVAKRELECSSLSSAPIPTTSPAAHGHGHAHSHPRPLRRLIALLKLDARDVWTVGLFALVGGTLTLATPLAVESLVNVVSWGTYLQPLLVLAVMLLACLGLAGVLRILQTIVVEMIQRRQFVRIVGDFAHRFPRAQQAALAEEYPRELANRFFDIVTIQKATASLLLDGLSIVLTAGLGMLLLAFYHPYLLGFDLILLFSMVSITWALGRGGISTAIDESIVKYRIAHWLQDVIASPTAFKINGGEMLAVERANRLTTEYLVARQAQFRVVIRQVAFAVTLHVIASTALLGLGGWLVIRQQLTLGQLVASELVVTIVVGAFAKAGKALEQFYDLMAGIDKVGHLLDIPVDPRFELGDIPAGPATVRWDELTLHHPATSAHCHVPAAKLPPGAIAAIFGSDRSGRSLLLRCLAGISNTEHGMTEVGGLDAYRASLAGHGRFVGYAGPIEVFHAALHENVDLGRSDVGQSRVREVLVQVGLWDDVLRLPDGLKSQLQTNGAPLTVSQRSQLIIAQAMAGRPRLLLLDGVLDILPTAILDQLWPALTAADAPWTLIVATNHRSIAARCPIRIDLEEQA